MVDKDINQKLMAGLVDCNSINEIKIMGAIVNPMFQNVRRMMSAGLCTKKQHDAGEEELLRRMKQMIDYSILDNGNEPIKNTTETKAGNEWDDSDNEYNNLNISKAAGSAREEIGVFYSWKHSKYLPIVSPTKILEPRMRMVSQEHLYSHLMKS